MCDERLGDCATQANIQLCDIIDCSQLHLYDRFAMVYDYSGALLGEVTVEHLNRKLNEWREQEKEEEHEAMQLMNNDSDKGVAARLLAMIKEKFTRKRRVSSFNPRHDLGEECTGVPTSRPSHQHFKSHTHTHTHTHTQTSTHTRTSTHSHTNTHVRTTTHPRHTYTYHNMRIHDHTSTHSRSAK